MKTVTARIAADDYEQCRHFVLNILIGNSITKEIISETMLIFEALYYNLRNQSENQITELYLSGREAFGDIRIAIGFEGKVFDPLDDTGNDFSPEIRILRAYADKIDHSYHSGYNKISISVRRRYRRTVISCMLWIMLAFALYLPLHMLAGPQTEEWLLESIVYPSQKVFTNAILMIGAPVTFLSLIKNFTDVYILSERNSGVRKIQSTTLITSVIAIILAVAVSTGGGYLIRRDGMVLPEMADADAQTSISELISSLMPPSIFEPFVSISPIPLIILAALFTYAFCSVGKYFDTLKQAVDAGYVLCSRVLTVIMSALPFFIFAAVMDMLLTDGFAAVRNSILFILTVAASLVIMMLFYAVRLKIKGIHVKPFVKKLWPLIAENMKISSAIDAVPFNIRYCSRVFEMDRKRLETELPVLAQINLDGNCYMLTFVALLLMYAGIGYIPAWSIVIVSLLVLFLSLGAPNQPGTFVIGLVIVFTFFSAERLLPVAIISEVFFGWLVNIINVTGDIVTAVENERRSRSKTSH